MKNNNWKEKEPLPCEVCKCCKIDYVRSSLNCRKYEIKCGVVFGFEALYKRCKCKKNYPSFWKKLFFRFECFVSYVEDVAQYLEDIKYYRFDD